MVSLTEKNLLRLPLEGPSLHVIAAARELRSGHPQLTYLPNSKVSSKSRSKVSYPKQSKSELVDGERNVVLRLRANIRCTIKIPTLQRKFNHAPDVPTSVHLTRLKTLITIMESSYFSPDSGSYPTAIDWTSTVLATHLINYFDHTNDHRYFSHLVAFFQRQNIPSLIRQNYDDQLWVVLTFLRGAAYASAHEPEWVDPFLERASVFYDVARSGWDEETCGGGMVWGRWQRYKNAVTTELWIAASVGMYEVFGEDRMLDAAVRGWIWLKKSGMLNEEGLVNDGLDEYCEYVSSLYLR